MRLYKLFKVCKLWKLCKLCKLFVIHSIFLHNKKNSNQNGSRAYEIENNSIYCIVFLILNITNLANRTVCDCSLLRQYPDWRLKRVAVQEYTGLLYNGVEAGPHIHME